MMKITVRIPSDYMEERNYVAKTIFQTFLGLDYEVIPSKIDVTIMSWNDRSITFKDAFWRNGGGHFCR